MRNPELRLSFGQDELIVDNFAGGGGASTGIEAALGRPIDIAINHDPEALAMHRVNHPHTLHLCEDVFDVDIKQVIAGRKVGLVWLSPDCTHFSRAKGGKPRDNKSRGLAWVALKWAKMAQPRVMVVENVCEFLDWTYLIDGQPDMTRKGLVFKRWVTQLRNAGYDKIEWRKIRACDYGAPTIRERLFIVLRRDGLPIVWPEPTHAPKPTAKLKPYRTAAECIDWSIPCPSIFLGKDDARALGIRRPLADATLRRIAKGVSRYVIQAQKPFIVNLTHHGSDRNESIEQPMATITAAHRGEKALVMPTLIQTGYGERQGQSPRVPGLAKPLGTAVAGGIKHALVGAFLSQQQGQSVGSSLSNPTRTSTAVNHHALVSAFLSYAQHGGANRTAQEPAHTITASRKDQNAVVAAFLAKHYGGVVGTSVTQPTGTITSVDHHSLVAAFISSYYGEKRPTDARGAWPGQPLATQPTENRHAVVTSHIMKMRGDNIGSSMEEPVQTISAQGQHHAEVRAFLMAYYGTDQDPKLDSPLQTVTTKDRFGLITVNIDGEPYYITDIGMRMLAPAELFRAQGFPEDYVIEYGRKHFDEGVPVKLTKTAQVRMVGNSVSPPPAEAIVRAQFLPISKEAVA